MRWPFPVAMIAEMREVAAENGEVLRLLRATERVGPTRGHSSLAGSMGPVGLHVHHATGLLGNISTMPAR